MEAFAHAGESKLVFIINELDKANEGKGNGNPADVLLTLLDNLGFTDNYMECMIPTDGVYPIATANDKSKISAPIMSRFAVIEIPDYTMDEKKIIFSRFSLPKILKRMSMNEDEIEITDDGLTRIAELCSSSSGIRDVEQVAEHIAGNALYRIEVEHVNKVTYNAEDIIKLIE
jgi:ATP-dependent Lon protease